VGGGAEATGKKKALGIRRGDDDEASAIAHLHTSMLARTLALRRAAALTSQPPTLLRAAASQRVTARWLCADAKKPEDAAAAEPAAEPAAEGAAAEEGAAAGAAAEGAAAEGEEAGPADRVAELEAQVAELEAQVKEKHDRMMLGLADADNARRRANIDVENAHKFAVGKSAKSLLDVADNLGRAADSVPEEAIAENEQLKMLHEGVTMTSTMLLKTFEQHGLQRVDPLGEKFDPNLHNALFEVPDPAQEPGTIAHVQNYGYSLHDRVIRPADVGIVAKR